MIILVTFTMRFTTSSNFSRPIGRPIGFKFCEVLKTLGKI